MADFTGTITQPFYPHFRNGCGGLKFDNALYCDIMIIEKSPAGVYTLPLGGGFFVFIIQTKVWATKKASPRIYHAVKKRLLLRHPPAGGGGSQ